MKVKVETEKVGLKLKIQKTKIMASGPITSWQIEGETVADFIFGGSKITADGDCSHEIKRRLLLGRKVQPTRLLHPWVFQARVLEWGAIAFSNDQPRQHIKKQRHYFVNKGLSS